MANVFYPGTVALQENQIRLIRLLPGHWGDDIQCDLLYDPSWNVRPYYALSYVWGSPKTTRPIRLDGHVFPVTVNLESALRHLRHKLPDALFWVDALCINQADNQERTHQVQLMGTIYRSCKSVLVYLGDGIGNLRPVGGRKAKSSAPPITKYFDDDRDIPKIESFLQASPIDALDSTNLKPLSRTQHTENVFSFIRTLSWVDHLSDMPLFALENNDWDVQGDLLRLFEALRQLMHAPYTPWWGRIWVVQEVVLPPEVIVICGTVSAPWTMFARAASRSLHHIRHCCSKYAENLPRDYLHVIKDFCQRVLDVEDLRSTYLENAANAKRENAGLIIHKTIQISLVSLLRRFRSRKASDPRDKVYALLSLVQPDLDRPAIQPDYSLSEPEVYTQAALHTIYNSGSLSILNTDLTRKVRQDLPTWVPDWEAPGDFTHNARMDTIEMYDVCANGLVNPLTVQVHGENHTLCLNGRYIDAVVVQGSVMLSDSSDNFRETLTDWLTLQRNYLGVTAVETKRTLWRVLCADVLCYPQTANAGDTLRRAGPEDELMFVTWALMSERSPFYNRRIRLDDYISETAQIWQHVLDLEISIESRKTEEVVRNFEILFPDQTKRRSLLLDAFENAETAENILDEHLKMELITYVTQSYSEIMDVYLHIYGKRQADQGSAVIESQPKDEQEALAQIARKCQAVAWKQIPWSEVLKIVKYEKLSKLSSVSIEFIPKDTQKSIMDRSIVSATKARRLFLTRMGYIGLGPANLHVGDMLLLMQGGRTPFFVRDDNPKHYPGLVLIPVLRRNLKLVGDCYAYGLMDSSTLKEHLINACSKSWTQFTIV